MPGRDFPALIQYTGLRPGEKKYEEMLMSEVSMQETRGFLQKVYRGSLGMMINAMVEDQALSQEEIQELYDILEQAKHRDR